MALIGLFPAGKAMARLLARVIKEEMLKLDDPRWADLNHAYGSAADIPSFLSQLNGLPASDGNDEPWFTLWSSLAHQGDVYPATFAAVPYIVRALATNPAKASYTYFQFPAWVEICRKRKAISVPDDLAAAYFEALNELPSLVAAAASRDWDSDFLPCALSAIAAAKGQTDVAEAVLELNPEVAAKFLKWFFER
jgi:hypothetical protein